MTSFFDVVVVGAGPSGCFLSKGLSGSGLRVLLVDANFLPRNKPCGGLLVEESRSVLKGLGMPDGVFSEPGSVALRHVDVDNKIDFLHERKLANISRPAFDFWLAGLAREASVFSGNTFFRSLKVVDGGLRVFLEHKGKAQKVFARFLVGADGAASKVRGFVSPRLVPRYLAFQEIGILKKPLRESVFVYDDRVTDYYSWVVPKGGSVLVGSALPLGRKANFSIFSGQMRRMGFSWKTVGKEAALLSRPSTVQEVVLGKGNVFLLGEAAGLISSSTGEGISFALRSALACAKALGFSDALAKYEELASPLVEEVGEKVIKASLLSKASSRALVFKRLPSK